MGNVNVKEFFEGDEQARLDEALKTENYDSGNLIAILQKTQEIFGYLPMEAIYYIADEIGSSPAHVLGVATFYAQFSLEKVGKNLIMLCKGTACHVNNADSIETTIEKELGIKNGQTSSDGLFSLKCVACLGCCSLSPAMMINGKTYGSLTPDKVKTILASYREGEE